jgi:hypothetical protein
MHPLLLAALGLGGLYLLTRNSSSGGVVNAQTPNPTQAQLNTLAQLDAQTAQMNAANVQNLGDGSSPVTPTSSTPSDQTTSGYGYVGRSVGRRINIG